MIPIKNPPTFNTLTPTIFMVGRCLSLLQLANSNGLKYTPHQISDLTTSENKGYLLEVDIKNPTDLHDSHNDLSFMCDKQSRKAGSKS